MKYVLFKLSMPRVNSWNGKWSGADKNYHQVRTLSDKWLNTNNCFQGLLKTKSENFSYDFGDGWVANVELSLIEKEHVQSYKNISDGFAGYDWMIDSIILHGEIRIK